VVSFKNLTVTQIATVIALLSSHAALAAPPDAGSLLRQQQMQQQLRTPLQIPQVSPAAEEEEKLSGDGGILIPVRDLRISGAVTAFPSELLKSLVADAIGQSLGLDALQSLVSRITQHYRSRGYFLSRAYLPPQDATDGTITIAVQEVGLDPSDNGIEIVSDNLRLRRDIARRIIIEAVPTGIPMRETDLERALLLLNRLPGLSAQANLEPGSLPTTSRLLMGLDEGELLNFNLGYDNAAGRYNGTDRFSAGIRLNNLTGIGDQLILSANRSNSDNTYSALNYSRPVGYRGLMAYAGYHHLNYRLGEELTALDANGYSDHFNMGLDYPVKLTRLESLWVRAGLEYKVLVDRANGITTSDKTVQPFNLGADWQRFHADGVSQASAELRFGELDIDSATNAFIADQGVNGPRKNGNYSLFRLNLSRLQRIDQGLSLYVDLHGQLADNNLDSSEQLQFGGPYGVRAYPIGEGNADEGAKLTLEGRYNLQQGTALGNIQTSLFYDTAWLSQYHDAGNINLNGLPNHYRLSGWGIGINATNPGKSQLSLTWAHKIGDNPLANPLTGKDADGTGDDSRLWAMASFYF